MFEVHGSLRGFSGASRLIALPSSISSLKACCRFVSNLFFSVGGELKTKLNKLLIYADFKHFKEYWVSATGAHYFHLQYGPVPDDYDYDFAELSRERFLDVEEDIFGNYTGFRCVARVEPRLEIFHQSERDVLEQVSKHFRNFGSVEIKNFSHEEVANALTNDGEMISYLHARDLRISKGIHPPLLQWRDKPGIHVCGVPVPMHKDLCCIGATAVSQSVECSGLCHGYRREPVRVIDASHGINCLFSYSPCSFQ